MLQTKYNETEINMNCVSDDAHKTAHKSDWPYLLWKFLFSTKNFNAYTMFLNVNLISTEKEWPHEIGL